MVYHRILNVVPMLDSRTLLFIHPIYNSLPLLIPNSHSILPSPALWQTQSVPCVCKSVSVSYLSSFASRGSDDKESTHNAGDPGCTPGSGRSPGEGSGYPLQYSCLENSMFMCVYMNSMFMCVYVFVYIHSIYSSLPFLHI